MAALEEPVEPGRARLALARLERLPLLSAAWVGLLGLLYAGLLTAWMAATDPGPCTGSAGTLFLLFTTVFAYAFCGAVVTYFTVSDCAALLRQKLATQHGLELAMGRMRIWMKFGVIFVVLTVVFLLVFVDLWLSGVLTELGRFQYLVIDVVIGLGLSLLLLHLIRRDLSRPIAQLLGAFDRVREGDLSVKAPVISDDETSLLTDRFNGMVGGLRERERIREVFGRYVERSVADQVLRRGAGLGSDVRLVTILFRGIAGYTSLSERLSPEETVSLLNDYFSFAVGCLTRHRGVVNKYIGDSVLAMFNAPADDPDHAANAVRAAVELIDGSRGRRFGKGLPIATRIGINTGLVLAGSIGSVDRLEYTVIGDEVNVASRLEQLNKQFGTQILVGELTAKLAREAFRFTPVAEVPLKGKTEPIRVYTVPSRAAP